MEGLQDTVPKSDEPHIQISLIALLSLSLQIHGQLCGDNRLDIVGLGQRFQLHIIVQHQKLMFQVGTGKVACLHLCHASGFHVGSQQRTKNNADPALAFAALSRQHEHLLTFGGGDEAIADKFL